MTTTAGEGILGFGPQAAKGVGVVDGSWFRHKSPQIGLGVIDGQQVGPQEVGGRPLPSTPYKTGVAVAGAAVLYPRLENSLGWLLYGALGYQKSHAAAVNFIGVLNNTLLTSSPQTISTGFAQPPSSRKLAVRVYKGDNQTFTGSVVITDSLSTSETFDFSTGPSGSQRSVGLTSKETIVGATSFTDIASITLPGVAISDVYVSVGWEEAGATANVFTIDPGHPSRVKWMGFRKYIPGGDDDALLDYGVGETYKDCKVLGLGITLPNDGLVSSQLSLMGRTFKYETDPAWGVASGTDGGWSESGEFEGYESIPIGCQVAGYLSIPSYDGLELPIINAGITLVNNPLDSRYERNYGSPYRNSITVNNRAVQVDITCMLQQDLYRQILTGSKVGTEWSPKPFTTRIDALAESPDFIPGLHTKYGLRVEIAKAMLSLSGAIPLVGNQPVLMRFTGIAIDSSADYCQFTLTNEQAGYTWPS